MQLTAIVGAVTASAVAGLAAYAVYFDYKRRNDVEFRRDIKKSKRHHAKQQARELKSKEEKMIEMLKAALDLVKDVEYPAGPDREKFFMENIQNGELLFRQGPDMMVESAVCFYKAVKIYPSPMDLMVLLQKSVPEDVLGLVYGMLSMDQQMQQMQQQQQAKQDIPAVLLTAQKKM